MPELPLDGDGVVELVVFCAWLDARNMASTTHVAKRTRPNWRMMMMINNNNDGDYNDRDDDADDEDGRDKTGASERTSVRPVVVCVRWRLTLRAPRVSGGRYLHGQSKGAQQQQQQQIKRVMIEASNV